MIVLAAALLLLGQESAGRRTIGIHDNWGAFADASPRRCYAIARPVGRSADSPAFASVASWPRERLRSQLHIRLSRARHPRAGVALAVGERRFELVAGESDAWAPDARTDAAIIAAIRSGRSMSIETLSAGGRPFVDVYALKGAATAIDAAALACAGG